MFADQEEMDQSGLSNSMMGGGIGSSFGGREYTYSRVADPDPDPTNMKTNF